MTQSELFAFLAARRLAVLSTVGPEGRPQSALIGYVVTPDLRVVFDTVQATRKYPNLMARPEVSLVFGWEGAETVQYEGVAEVTTDEALKEAYFAVWPEGRERARTWDGVVFFAIRPQWVRYCDYAPVPPRIEETSY